LGGLRREFSLESRAKKKGFGSPQEEGSLGFISLARIGMASMTRKSSSAVTGVDWRVLINPSLPSKEDLESLRLVLLPESRLVGWVGIDENHHIAFGQGGGVLL
jgi:hypothetical protein